MDPHVRWLRGRIARAVAILIACWLVVASALSFGVLLSLTEGGLIALLPWALVFGQVVVGAGLVRAMFSNPLSYPYLLSLVDKPPRFDFSERQAEQTLVDRFARHHLVPLVTLDEAVSGDVAFDLFQTPSAAATVARHRGSGSISIFSRLSDDRIIVTDSILTVPHRRLVVNRAGSERINDLIDAHRRAVEAERAVGCDVVADDGFVFVETLAIEHESLMQVGPVLGPFLNLTAESVPLRFLQPVSVDELTGSCGDVLGGEHRFPGGDSHADVPDPDKACAGNE